MLDDEHHQQFRDVVAVKHVGLAFVIEGREELAGRRFALFEFGDFVELRPDHGEVGLRAVFRRRLAELRVEEEGKQGRRDNVSGNGLFVIFGHSERTRPQAGVGDENVDAWQFSLDSVGKDLDRNVRAHVEVPHLKGIR